MLYIKKQTTKFAILSALLVALTGCAATEDSSSGSGSSSYVLKVSVSGLQQGRNVILNSGRVVLTGTAADLNPKNLDLTEYLGIF